MKQAASLNRARQYRLAHYFALLLGCGYLAISDAKSDVIFLLFDDSIPISYRDDEISHISCIVFEIPIYWVIFAGLGLLLAVLGYLSSSGTKSDFVFMFGEPALL